MKTTITQEQKREQFNNIIRGIDMILMNRIVDVDPSVYDNWEPGCAPEDDDEVYQWFAVGANDADFLGRYGQNITYSDLLDTHFLAITHFGTSWDYTSMVDDFEELYS